MMVQARHLRASALALCTCMALATLASGPAAAQATTGAPYDERLLRLSQVLGSIHYVRNLCGDKTTEWRAEMEALLAVEKPDPARRALLISSFNRGYRSFGSVYEQCTLQALEAAESYREEGARLANEINSLYGE